jgi:hypothetical protein
MAKSVAKARPVRPPAASQDGRHESIAARRSSERPPRPSTPRAVRAEPNPRPASRCPLTLTNSTINANDEVLVADDLGNIQTEVAGMLEVDR